MPAPVSSPSPIPALEATGEHAPACRTLCRPHCGACCTAPSISSPLPGLPHGKPAGVPCPHLDADLRCQLFGQPERPAVCGSLQPSQEMCGSDQAQAMAWLTVLEHATR